jgi:hypothetical protein
LLLRPSRALDALRKARLYGTLRDAVILVIGAALVVVSSVLPPAQEIILAAGGGILQITGIVFLVLRQLRGYRMGSES